MHRITLILATSLAFGSAAVSGCQRGGNVEEEMQDLKEAQKNTANVAQDLEQQLEETKAEVAQLEEKLALARRGVTDEVLEERQELEEALKHQERSVEREVAEAQKEAQEHNVDSQKARGALEETVPARVDAEVKTQTEVVPGHQQGIEAGQTEETIEIEQHRVETEETEQTKQETPKRAPAPQS